PDGETAATGTSRVRAPRGDAPRGRRDGAGGVLHRGAGKRKRAGRCGSRIVGGGSGQVVGHSPVRVANWRTRPGSEPGLFGERSSMQEGDHGRATYLLRTGYLPQGPIRYPSLGALVSKELGDARSELPNFVSIAPFRVLEDGAFGSGFLGPNHAPLVVGERAGGPAQNDADRALRVENLLPPAAVDRDHTSARIDLLRQVQSDFLAGHTDAPALSHQSADGRAVRLMRASSGKAFDLTEERSSVRDAYGRNLFGQGCLLARRLVERGVPFIEVTLNGWDTHGNNAAGVRNLSQT